MMSVMCEEIQFEGLRLGRVLYLHQLLSLRCLAIAKYPDRSIDTHVLQLYSMLGMRQFGTTKHSDRSSNRYVGEVPFKRC
jgi:hypothetical protein